MKGKVETGPWVRRHEDTPVTFSGQPHSWGVKQSVVGFPRSSRHFLLSESVEKMRPGECKGNPPSWSMVIKWSLGKHGRTQTRVFSRTFPDEVASCLNLLDSVTRGNGHKPASLVLVLYQSRQIMVWSIQRQNSSSLLLKLFGADLQIWVHKAQPRSCSWWPVADMPPVRRGDVSAWLTPALSLCSFHSYAMLAAPELCYKLQQWAKVINGS